MSAVLTSVQALPNPPNARTTAHGKLDAGHTSQALESHAHPPGRQNPASKKKKVRAVGEKEAGMSFMYEAPPGFMDESKVLSLIHTHTHAQCIHNRAHTTHVDKKHMHTRHARMSHTYE